MGVLPPEEQYEAAHNADVVISPHGSQLTNFLLAPECTGVLEIFPAGFYAKSLQVTATPRRRPTREVDWQILGWSA